MTATLKVNLLRTSIKKAVSTTCY